MSDQNTTNPSTEATLPAEAPPSTPAEGTTEQAVTSGDWSKPAEGETVSNDGGEVGVSSDSEEAKVSSAA